MKINVLLIAVLSMLVVFTSCEDDQKVRDAKLSLGFEAVQSTNTLKATDTLVVDSATMTLQEIELESEEEYEMENDSMEVEKEVEREYELEGPYQLDLLAGTRITDLADIEPGLYKELEAEIAPADDNGHSVYIKGRYTNPEGATHELIYHTNESFDFEVESEEGIQVSDQEIKELIVRIDLNILFQQVDLSSAALDDDNRILIHEAQNEALAEQIKTYLEEVSEIEEDDDDDDDDDEDEEDK
jgi:hypothetical protein